MNEKQLAMLNPIWHEDITLEMKVRDDSCKKNRGPFSIYAPKNKNGRDVNNPYKYKNVAEFTKKVPFNKNHCRFMHKPDASKDEHDRYFNFYRKEGQCINFDNKNINNPKNKEQGYWSEKDINRYNKYSNGVCWVSDVDKECGSLGNSELLKPSKVKQFIREGKLSIKELELFGKCTMNDKCKVAQVSKYAYDCVDKRKYRSKPENNNVNVPYDFPFDITNEGSNAEELLYNWYVLGKFKKPKTSDLIGQGNRCVAANGASNAITKDDIFYNPTRKLDVPKIDQLIDLDMKIEENREKFKTSLEMYYNITDETLLKRFFEKLQTSKDGKLFVKRILEAQKFDNDDDVDINGGITINNPLLGIPSVPQSIVNMLMKNIARNPEKSSRGLMAWFSTGAGKTICATGVMDAFWNTEKQIIFVSSLDALASNPESTFYEAALIFPRFQDPIFISNTKEKTLEKIGNEFKRRKIRFLSFAKLSNRVKKTIEYKNTISKKMGGGIGGMGGGKIDKSMTISDDNYIDLDNSVLIIDEVHNLFRPEFNQAKEHKYLENQLLDPKLHPKLKMAILTATPGDNVEDIIKLLNMIRNNNKPIDIPDVNKDESITKFKKDIKGLISYFNMNGDRSKFPIVTETAHNYAEMTDKQYEAYKEVLLKKTDNGLKDFKALEKKNATGKYYNPARKYANMLYNFEKGVQLNEFSAKMPLLISKFRIYTNDKHYVYSSFYERRGYGGHGVVGIGKELEKMGYTKFTVDDAVKFNSTSSVPPPGKRYILAISTEIEEAKGKMSVGEKLKELLKIYNHPENKDGKLIHIMLASNKFNEGIDLKAVKHIHFFEPLVTMASDKQTIGRAARNCSHAHLDQSEWTVKIHRYLTNLPIENEFNQVNVENIKRELESMEQKLVQLEDQKKNAEKGSKKELTTQISNVKKEIKEKTKEVNTHTKENNAKIINVEKKIFAESRERMKGIETIYHAMREAAVDCRVMEKFHETSENPVRCMR